MCQCSVKIIANLTPTINTALILLCVFTFCYILCNCNVNMQSLSHKLYIPSKDVLHESAEKPHEIAHLCYMPTIMVEKEEKNHDHCGHGIIQEPFGSGGELS